MAIAVEDRDHLLVQILERERKPQLNYRNMLSAHTTNRPGAPLWPTGNLAACFHAEPMSGGIVGHLHLPHSFHNGDNQAVRVQSDVYPNTKSGEKGALNQACLRALVVLLKSNPMEVRLVPTNFLRGVQGLRDVQRAAQPEPEAVGTFQDTRLGVPCPPPLVLPPAQHMEVILEEPATEQPPPPLGPPPGWRAATENPPPPPGPPPSQRAQAMAPTTHGERVGKAPAAIATVDHEPPTPTPVTASDDLEAQALYVGITAAKFDGTEFGEEYLSFTPGIPITESNATSDGWAYGQIGGQAGWFPPTDVQYDAPVCMSASASRMGCCDDHDADDTMSITSSISDCFMADNCFKVPSSAHQVHYVKGSDLVPGNPVFAGDGTLVEVKRINSHETDQVIELLAGDARNVVTRSHRVPIVGDVDGRVEYKQAKELELGDRVLFGDGCPSALTRIKYTQLSIKKPVVELTFEPDLPVAALELSEAMLTNGSRKKTLRRGGMQKRRAQGTSNAVAASIPDTEGEYQD